MRMFPYYNITDFLWLNENVLLSSSKDCKLVQQLMSQADRPAEKAVRKGGREGGRKGRGGEGRGGEGRGEGRREGREGRRGEERRGEGRGVEGRGGEGRGGGREWRVYGALAKEKVNCRKEASVRQGIGVKEAREESVQKYIHIHVIVGSIQERHEWRTNINTAI